MRQNLQPAYVIHTRAFRDTSMIVELFTPEHGRVSVLARGVKTGKAQKSLLLQPFRGLHISWAGRGELPVMSMVEEAGNSLRLQGQALACGYYVNELIYHLLPRDDPAPELFANYWSVVSALDDPASRDSALRQFELELLLQIGYEPLLDYDYLNGEPVSGDKVYRYNIPEGPAAVADDPACYEVGRHAVSNQTGTRTNSSVQVAHAKPAASRQQDSLQKDQPGLLIGGQALLDLAQGNYSNPASLKDARNLMRSLIHHQLDGRKLLSRVLFSSYRKLDKSITND